MFSNIEPYRPDPARETAPLPVFLFRNDPASVPGLRRLGGRGR
jgi:hypothetical protein